jgi:hypothetical protein
MLTINTSAQELSPELTSFLMELKPNVERYNESTRSAAKERMIIIGKISDYKCLHPQHSADHKLLNGMMLEEWSRDVIDNNVAAYKQYLHLHGNVNPEFKALAEAAEPTALMVLQRSDDTSVVYDAAMYLKKNGKVPGVSKLKGHIAGHHDKDFNHVMSKKGTSASIRKSDPKDQLAQSIKTITDWLPTVSMISPAGKDQLSALRAQIDRVLAL